MITVPSAVIDACLIECHVDAVAEVVTERRVVEHSPAAVVRDIHAVVLIVVQRARVHQNVTCNSRLITIPRMHCEREYRLRIQVPQCITKI